ncbi:hypothetical protein F383_04050 [Gossypium arboreum]|uniref:Uncharacterized protein n=1 Tax=Gossypium arboreum TaxID=29729 RepID=A0A0B0NCE4_GOSAR|nr:hypothetical protein F383_04050 [Gossypium arboreum]
MDRLAFFK